MKVLVTGHKGFAGTYLYELLAKGGPVSPRRSRGGKRVFGLDLPEVDITKPREVKRFIKKIQPDEIYHLAGFASTKGKKELIFKINVEGTKNLLSACLGLKKPPRILLVSSLYVYFSPLGPYGQSKAAMEKLANKFPQLPILIVRSSNHFGPRQKKGFVLSDFASQIARIEKKKLPPLIEVGNLEAVRDFLDVRDVVRAYKIIMEKGRPGKIYNVSRGKGIKIKKLLRLLLGLTKIKIKAEIDKTKLHPLEIIYLVASPILLKKLGWQPKIPLEKTLKDTLNFWRKEIK